MTNSQVLTIGTALRLAMDACEAVEVFVGQQRFCGLVFAVDQHGAVLRDPIEDRMTVLRLEHVSAISVQTQVVSRQPQLDPIPV